MSQGENGVDPQLRHELRTELRHRIRPMPGRDPGDRGRSASPLELLYDLTYVIAFGFAAEQLAHHVVAGDVGPAVGVYVFAVFAVTWAWINSTWFASAYDNDDALVRIATIVQMGGVLILTFGLPRAFEAGSEGHNPNDLLLVVGYLIMRVPLIALWLRAARQDVRHRRTAVAYAVAIGVAQVGWVLTAVLPLPVPVTVAALGVLAIAEMVAPVVIERRIGGIPWNPAHLADRFALLTIITLGEVLAATAAAATSLVGEAGWTPPPIVIAGAGLVLAGAFWWAYYLIPSRTILTRWPERVFEWRYAHLPLFGGIAAVGGGLRTVALAIEHGGVSLLGIALAVVIPIAVVVATVFVTWSVLMRSYDLAHVPLFLLSLAPLVAAVAIAASAGDGELDPEDPGQLGRLVAVMGLAALSFVIEVVGHERVGYRHTLREVERRSADTPQG